MFIKSLDEHPKEIRSIELTYFSLSITSIVFLQFTDSTNKKSLLDEVVHSVLSEKATEQNLSTNKALDEYQERLSDYNMLFSNLFNEDSEESPIVSLFVRFYECVMQKSAESKVFRTVKVGKIISQYIIDSINYAKQEYRLAE
ncbi:MAG: hypothetical protein U5K69_19545 [Balneolaceae bacterium]|nr:hypothetical protein [Balneolaceae bacterium]